jgi:hypothetical protein
MFQVNVVTDLSGFYEGKKKKEKEKINQRMMIR